MHMLQCMSPLVAHRVISWQRSKRSLWGGGFNWSAQHLLILRGEEVFHGDVTD